MIAFFEARSKALNSCNRKNENEHIFIQVSALLCAGEWTVCAAGISPKMLEEGLRYCTDGSFFSHLPTSDSWESCIVG